MNQTAEPILRNPFGMESNFGRARHIPILPSSTTSTNFSQADIMDITPPASASMIAPTTSSPEAEGGGQRSRANHNSQGANGSHGENGMNSVSSTGANGTTLSAAAAASSQQPKVVQTAFIHKLYNMLEDQTISHLISWSASNESFVVSPSPEFSKVLAQYFKHTNISSFVRQLNMYGFHKEVSDVFHTGQPDPALWEFKHGNGNFKKGDLTGLREIKRRASRHALIHREPPTPPHKASVSQPGTPAEPAADQGDPRLVNIEHSLYELHARLLRTEESNTALSTKCAVLSEGLARCQQWNNEMTQIVMKMVPDREGQVYRDLSNLQRDVARILDTAQRPEEHHEGPLSSRQPYSSNLPIDSVQLSPRQVAQDERRTSFQAMSHKPSPFRPPAPPHLSISPRRFGSIGSNNHSPSYRPIPNAAPLQPPMQHPLASVSEPGINVGRRHTSADIRDTAGWAPQVAGMSGSMFDGGPPTSSTVNWPPSPRIQAPSPSDQQVRDVLASYTLGQPRRESHNPSRQASSPPPSGGDVPPSGIGPTENGFSPHEPRWGGRLMDSAPQNRRSSMASNVHNLLNPAESGDGADEDGNDDRKRKRV
ncbi:MAG: hypothetical protein LQ340_002039 [Diploschistes diacapsis]|nr:MAG: hypothetical protein LQ340_002039 [Diploschistes diacapsis]